MIRMPKNTSSGWPGYPTLYVPYLALGDLYTARREFAKAEELSQSL